MLHELRIAATPDAPAAACAAVERLAGSRVDEASAHLVGPLVAGLVAQTLGGGHAVPQESVLVMLTLLPRAVRVEVADPAGPAWCEFARPLGDR